MEVPGEKTHTSCNSDGSWAGSADCLSVGGKEGEGRRGQVWDGPWGWTPGGFVDGLDVRGEEKGRVGCDTDESQGFGLRRHKVTLPLTGCGKGRHSLWTRRIQLPLGPLDGGPAHSPWHQQAAGRRAMRQTVATECG